MVLPSSVNVVLANLGNVVHYLTLVDEIDIVKIKENDICVNIPTCKHLVNRND